MEAVDRIYLCTSRDLAIRARNHLHTFAAYYARHNNGHTADELDDAEEWLSNEVYRCERELANETPNP